MKALLSEDLSADAAVEIAMMRSPRLQMALAEVGIARGELIESSTIANPLLQADIRFPASPFNPFELRLSQTLVELIQLPKRRAIGRVAFQAASLRVTSEVLRFAADVRAAYYDLVASTLHLGRSRTIAEARKAAAELAMRQHDAQTINDLDLETEQATYEQAKLELARAERNLLGARAKLTIEMGIAHLPVDWRVPDAFPPLPPEERTQEELERLTAAQRLDLAIARLELDIARRRVPISRLAAFGEITIHGDIQREPDGIRTYGPGIDLPIPIFNTGRGARTRAEAAFVRARHLVDALTQEASATLAIARVTLDEARARVEYFRDVLLPRRRRIVELTKVAHNAMLIGVFQLLQAAQNEAEAQRDSIEAQREYWTARTDLDRVLNGIPGHDGMAGAGRGIERTSSPRFGGGH
ncbi:MAG: TolC family protein [Thermoanaerobaculia bacterium]